MGLDFVGSALVRELLEQEFEVIVYDNFSDGRYENLEGLDCEIIRGDIRSWKLYAVMKRKPDYVFHLAAEPFIPNSYEDSENFIDTNVRGTLNVLMASHINGIQRVISYSTSEVYGTAQYQPMDEDHPTLPHSTYGVTKLAADRLCDVKFHEQGVPVLIVRPFNTYGPRETQPYIIPEVIRQLSSGDVLRLGNVKAKRDFTYVHDSAKAVIGLALSNTENGQVFNIGSSVAYSVEDIVSCISEIMGVAPTIELDPKKIRPKDIDLLRCDFSKLHNKTGWMPTTAISEGLAKTVNWYREHKKWSYE